MYGKRIIDNLQSVQQSMESCFIKQYKPVRKNIALFSTAILSCDKVNTAEISRRAGDINGKNFKANEACLSRLLQSDDFQIDDKMWRGYINFLFEMLDKNGLIEGIKQYINIGFTSDRDDFLILCAAIQIRGVNIPIYFSMRRYPKRKGQPIQTKTESAFFKALRHILPKKYEYVLVADRGFGNLRVFSLLDASGFGYVIRMNENLNIINGKEGLNLKNPPHEQAFFEKMKVKSWDYEKSVGKAVSGENFWILATNLAGVDANELQQIYKNRFAIEKMFKNAKSGGFGLEDIKIEKYERFKRVVFMCCISYSIMVCCGLVLQDNADNLKKKSFRMPNNLIVYLI